MNGWEVGERSSVLAISPGPVGSVEIAEVPFTSNRKSLSIFNYLITLNVLLTVPFEDCGVCISL